MIFSRISLNIRYVEKKSLKFLVADVSDIYSLFHVLTYFTVRSF